MRPTQENSFVKVPFLLGHLGHPSICVASKIFSILCAKRSSPLTFGCTITSCPASSRRVAYLQGPKGLKRHVSQDCQRAPPRDKPEQRGDSCVCVCVCVRRDVVLELEKMNKGKKTDSESQTGRGSFRRS